MSHLRDHIIAARAYEQAWAEARAIAEKADAGGVTGLVEQAIQFQNTHRRAAEIMEEQHATRYPKEPKP